MNKGFFFEEVIEKKKERTIHQKKQKAEKKELDLCEKCGLKNKCENNHLKKNIDNLVIIDHYNKNFSYIKSKLKFEYNLTFALQCENKKNISIAQLNYCRNKLHEIIKQTKPKKIFTFGKYALQGLIGDKCSINEDAEEWMGWTIPDQDFECYIYPNYHLINDEDKILNNRFEKFLNNHINHDKKFKKIYLDVNICEEDQAINLLRNLLSLKNEIIAIDVETTGLKPHKKGHQIYSIAITQSNLFTFSFLLTEKIKSYIKEILQSNLIGKVAHNLQFENRWFEFLLCEVNNWVFDTQLSTHILDNRSGITGLKFQTYVNFGLVGYDDNIKQYLQAKIKGGNEFNTIQDAPVKDLLKYNCYDTYFTMLLYFQHKDLLTEHLKNGFKLFLNGNIELSRLSGIKFDYDKYKNNYDILTKEINQYHEEIMNSKEVGLLEDKENFNYDSNKQLADLLFNVCGWKAKYTTKTKQASVAEKALKIYNKRFTNNILSRKKVIKIRDTYLDQFYREAVKINNEYFIYPFFSLNNVLTYRSASQNPNFQNIPSRNKTAKEMTRSTLIPRRGHQILEIDGKAMEVSMSCNYHKDPVMVDYVVNNGDMHADLAKQLFFRKNDFTKYERYCGKNGFVFPEFYGSTARIWSDDNKKNQAGDVTFGLWEMMEESTREHLKNNGIKDLQDFQRHVEKIEDDFWNNKFKIYKQWKMDNWAFYKEYGFIELKTGFICNSIMGFNQTSNYPIQGSAFHVMLYLLIKVNRILRDKKMNSVILGQIHDSLVIDLDPAEYGIVIKIIKNCIKEIEDEWDWMIVPIKIEAEITEIDQPWYLKKEIKI